MNTEIIYLLFGQTKRTVACAEHLPSMLEAFTVTSCPVLSQTPTPDACKHVVCVDRHFGQPHYGHEYVADPSES